MFISASSKSKAGQREADLTTPLVLPDNGGERALDEDTPSEYTPPDSCLFCKSDFQDVEVRRSIAFAPSHLMHRKRARRN